MACRLETLLSASSCEIRYCSDCGIVHLIMGSITLRLSAEHFQVFGQDLNKGLAQLRVRTIAPDSRKRNNIVILHNR